MGVDYSAEIVFQPDEPKDLGFTNDEVDEILSGSIKEWKTYEVEVISNRDEDEERVGVIFKRSDYWSMRTEISPKEMVTFLNVVQGIPGKIFLNLEDVFN